MGLLIDTDLLIDLERDTAAYENVLGDEHCAISVITVSELLHGLLSAPGATRARRAAFVEHVLAGLQAIPISEDVARVQMVSRSPHATRTISGACPVFASLPHQPEQRGCRRAQRSALSASSASRSPLNAGAGNSSSETHRASDFSSESKKVPPMTRHL
jgi:hypothetical protein